MKKCQTRNKRSLGSTLSRSYSPPSSAVVPVAKRGARPFGRCARFRLREMSVKVLIESDASSDGCDARKRPKVYRILRVVSLSWVICANRTCARKLFPAGWTIADNLAKSEAPLRHQRWPGLMTPNQLLLKLITDFASTKNRVLLGRTALIENNS